MKKKKKKRREEEEYPWGGGAGEEAQLESWMRFQGLQHQQESPFRHLSQDAKYSISVSLSCFFFSIYLYTLENDKENYVSVVILKINVKEVQKNLFSTIWL